MIRVNGDRGLVIRVLREEWRAGRLSLGGLPRGDRQLAIAALSVIAAACLVIVAAAVGVSALGPTAGVVGSYVDPALRAPIDVPLVVIPLICIGLAVGSGTLASAAIRTGGSAARRALIAVILGNAALGGIALTNLGATQVVAEAVGAQTLVPRLVGLTGVVGIGSAILLAGLVLARPARGRSLVPIVAAAPYVIVLAAAVLAAGQQGTLGPFQQAIYPAFPPILSLVGTVMVPLLLLVGLTSGMLFLLTLWQATTWSRASARLLGGRLGAYGSRMGWVLWLLLAMKLAWLSLGLGGALPPLLGGASAAWSAVRSDDVASWAYAVLLALGAGLWLLTNSRPVTERRALGYAPVVVAAIGGFSLILAAIPMVVFVVEGVAPRAAGASLAAATTWGGCLTDWPAAGLGSLVGCIGLQLPAWLNVYLLAVVGTALVAGLLIVARRGRDDAAVFLVVLGAMGLPRALAAARATAPPDFPAVAMLPAFNAPQPETMDVVVTLLVLALAALWWAGRQTTVRPYSLIVILVVSTLVVHAGSVVPTASIAAFAALAIVFPVAYELCFDSEALNADAPGRGTRLLTDLGIRSLALTLLAATVAVGLASEPSSTQQFAFIIFGLPFVVTVTAAAVTPPRGVRGSSERPPVAEQPGRAQRNQPFRPILAGVLIVAAAAVVGSLLQPQTRWLYPTSGERLNELTTRMDAVGTAVIELASAPEAGTGEKLQDLWKAEVVWLQEHAAPACASPVWRRSRQLLDRLRELGLVFVATDAASAGVAPTDLQALMQQTETIPLAVQADAASFSEEVSAARAACAGG
ncbi:MAG: hypothetical protein WKF56_04730 [Candidatus Limnocylindrales bacterium]